MSRTVKNDPLKQLESEPILPNDPKANWKPLITMVFVKALRDAKKDPAVIKWLKENGELYCDAVGVDVHIDKILRAVHEMNEPRLRGMLGKLRH
jgi:hypothetical protein